MRPVDKFIIKWANTFIKILVVFCIIYVGAMFIHVENRHVKFEKTQEIILTNQTNILNDIKNIKYDILNNLTNQKTVNVDVQHQIDNK